jgi:hypothetical protein
VPSRLTSARRLRAAAALVIGIAACSGGAAPGAQPAAEASVERSIEEVQEAYTPEWMSLPGVVGTAIGLCDDEPCIKVYVDRPVETLRDRIPSEVEGYTVILEQTDQIRARE